MRTKYNTVTLKYWATFWRIIILQMCDDVVGLIQNIENRLVDEYLCTPNSRLANEEEFLITAG
jgi:hypothetical protein